MDAQSDSRDPAEDAAPAPDAGAEDALHWRSGRRGKPAASTAKRTISPPKPVTILCGVLAMLWLFLGGWFLFAPDRLGGEPVAVAAITSPANLQNAASLEPDGLIRPSVSGTDSGAGRTVPALGDPNLQVSRDMQGGSGIIRISDPLAEPLFEDALVERTRYGPLPIIADTGRRSFQAYAATPPADSAGRPRIALILTGMGLSAVSTENAIRDLPGGVTFAFAPYGRDLTRLAASARRDGHEIMLQIPLEPFDYPDNDPGPHTLLTDLPERQNIDRLHWVMGRIAGYVGIINHMGAKFSSNDDAVRPILTELRNRGLLYVDDGAAAQSRVEDIAGSIGMPARIGDIIIDSDPSRAAVSEALDRLVKLAQDRGYAIGVASGLPVTLQALGPWIDDLENRGIALVPITAMIDTGGT